MATTLRNILIVSLNKSRTQSLESLLINMNNTSTHAVSPHEVRDKLKNGIFSVIFLDADDTAIKTAELCSEIRKFHPVNSCAIILFGKRCNGQELAQKLDAGADDYWNLPLNELVCLAYLRAILRRLTQIKPYGQPFTTGALNIDPQKRQVVLENKAIPLRAKEFDLLYYLLKHPGEALNRDTLLKDIWGYEYFGTTRTIDFHVAQLRMKLGALGDKIETVPGIGYRFSYKHLT